MKKLAYSLVIVFAGLFIVDRLGGFVMAWVSRNTNDVISPKLQYVSNGIHEDVVFMGASRCHHHYVPSIISDTLLMDVYNAGIGGSDNIFSHYIVLSHILKGHKPKAICLEVMPTDYNCQKDPFAVISFFAPLIGKCEEADSVFRMAGSYWKYEASHLYRYNAKASSNLWGLVLNRQRNDDNGYNPLPAPNQHPSMMAQEKRDTETDLQKLEYLHRFVTLCQQNNIKLIFTVSPKYTKVEDSHYDVIKRFAQKYDIPFLDYHTTGLYIDHPEYFKDASHLWDKGARLYSSVIASDLKKMLKRQN